MSYSSRVFNDSPQAINDSDYLEAKADFENIMCGLISGLERMMSLASEKVDSKGSLNFVDPNVWRCSPLVFKARF